MATLHDSTTDRKAAVLRYDAPDGDLDGIATRVAEGDALRDVTDAELTRRVLHLLPEVQALVDQARERHALLDALRQQREAASGGETAVPQPPPSATRRRVGPDPAGRAARPGSPAVLQHRLGTRHRHDARGHATRQPGRLVPAASGGDGAAQQCQGHLVQPLGSQRTTLLQGQVAMQPCGGRASSAST